MHQANQHVSKLGCTHRFLHALVVAGFLLILSGVIEHEELERAGVGFLVAPSARKSVVSFCQQSSRMVSLKIRVPGSKINLCSIYAPHSGKAFDETQTILSESGGVDSRPFWPRPIDSIGRI